MGMCYPFARFKKEWNQCVIFHALGWCLDIVNSWPEVYQVCKSLCQLSWKVLKQGHRLSWKRSTNSVWQPTILTSIASCKYTKSALCKQYKKFSTFLMNHLPRPTMPSVSPRIRAEPVAASRSASGPVTFFPSRTMFASQYVRRYRFNIRHIVESATSSTP